MINFEYDKDGFMILGGVSTTFRYTNYGDYHHTEIQNIWQKYFETEKEAKAHLQESAINWIAGLYKEMN